MPGRRNPRAKWVLPEVIDPPDHICITIPVPNDRQHIAAFWGALYNLTSAIFWADDTAHTARLVAKVWQEIYDKLAPLSCNPESPIPIEEWEDLLSICESLRIHDGKLQGLCCGEWTDIPGQLDGSGIGESGQPGGGSPQPASGGGQTCYHCNQQAAFQWLLPTAVSAGDTLTFSNFQGAAWDGIAPVPLPGRWDCPNGKFFFLGECQDGTEALEGTDPLPTAPHMSLVAQIAGTWYSCLSPITVPGGVSTAQVVVQLNDGAIGDNQGQYGFDVCVVNNAATAWSHLLDLTTAPHGASWNGAASFWTVGTGLSASAIGPNIPLRWRIPLPTATTITAVEITYANTDESGGPPENIVRTLDAALAVITNYPVNNALHSNIAETIHITAASALARYIEVNTNTQSTGSIHVTKLKVFGTGTEPVWP